MMPQLNKETRELLLSTAYAEREVNGRDGARVATAIELLIEWNDRAAKEATPAAEIDAIIGNAIDHCGYFMEGPVKKKVMLAAGRVRAALTKAGFLAVSEQAPATKSAGQCPDCRSTNTRFTGGGAVCDDCGFDAMPPDEGDL